MNINLSFLKFNEALYTKKKKNSWRASYEEHLTQTGIESFVR